MTKPSPINPFLATLPALAASARRAQAREKTIARLALLVGDRAEAQRAVELAERVGWYIEDLVRRAARGEPLPKTAEELRARPEARQRLAEDMMRALTGLR